MNLFLATWGIAVAQLRNTLIPEKACLAKRFGVVLEELAEVVAAASRSFVALENGLLAMKLFKEA